MKSEAELLQGMIKNRLLVPTGVPGVYGRGFHFEDVIERFDDLVTAAGRDDKPERLRFPPVIPRAAFEKSEYLKSMPQLAGTVWSFMGDQTEHMKLLELVWGGKDWGEYQKMTQVVLTPAACYPLYPMVADEGPLRPGGRLFDVQSYCFRHEPSQDPARQQMFRMREYVRVAENEDTVRAWRDGWVERGIALLQSVGLDASSADANDPFFGRAGRMLAANQREQKLKFEVLYPITSIEKPTALLSFNVHQDHFARIYGIRNADGSVASSGCVGFGLERVALALFATHGYDPAEWPASVRSKLYP
jgi:seryl-tRNA synthetase